MTAPPTPDPVGAEVPAVDPIGAGAPAVDPIGAEAPAVDRKGAQAPAADREAMGGQECDDADPETGPLRRCVVTRESLPKGQMIRFVLAPDRLLVPDLAEKLPGRGMWLSAKADVLERALKRGVFAKAARGPVQLPPELRARIEDGLRGRIRDLVGFARRSGQAVSGRDAVREWLRAGKVGLLVEASDGSPAERARMVGGSGLPVVVPLTAAVLGGVFARDQAVHVAIAPGRLAEGIATEAARLAGLAGTPESPGGRPSRAPAGA